MPDPTVTPAPPPPPASVVIIDGAKVENVTGWQVERRIDHVLVSILLAVMDGAPVMRLHDFHDVTLIQRVGESAESLRTRGFVVASGASSDRSRGNVRVVSLVCPIGDWQAV